MRKKIIAGNWKMYKSLSEAEQTVAKIANELTHHITDNDIYIATPFVYIDRLVYRFGNTGIKFGAQNLHAEDEGAYTGEVSAAMLQSINCYFVIIAHSERRAYFNETDLLAHEKIKKALQYNLQPIYCCGEKLESRHEESHFEIVKHQIVDALFEISADDIEKIVIAYEPVWAIGTGLTASPEQAQEMHAYIRALLSKKFGNTVAEKIRILYGGSVKAQNAKSLFSQPDIDGGLIGGASLSADDFMKIIQAC